MDGNISKEIKDIIKNYQKGPKKEQNEVKCTYRYYFKKKRLY